VTDLKASIAAAVAASGLSQRAIAEAAGIHPVTLSRYLTGKIDITTGPASRLLTVLGVPIAPAGTARTQRRPSLEADSRT